MAKKTEVTTTVTENGSGPITADELTPITEHIIGVLVEKDREYGSSWKKRGGIGAFMMLARKWDRLEHFVTDPDSRKDRYDILERALEDDRDEGAVSDIDDLIGYLLLVRAEISKRKKDTSF